MIYTIKTMNCVGNYLFPCKMKSLDIIKTHSDLVLVTFATKLHVRIKLQEIISCLVYSGIQIKKI